MMLWSNTHNSSQKCDYHKKFSFRNVCRFFFFKQIWSIKRLLWQPDIEHFRLSDHIWSVIQGKYCQSLVVCQQSCSIYALVTILELSSGALSCWPWWSSTQKWVTVITWLSRKSYYCLITTMIWEWVLGLKLENLHWATWILQFDWVSPPPWSGNDWRTLVCMRGTPCARLCPRNKNIKNLSSLNRWRHQKLKYNCGHNQPVLACWRL